MIKEAHDELLDIQSSGRSKELLAQVRVRAGEGEGEGGWGGPMGCFVLHSDPVLCSSNLDVSFVMVFSCA